MPKPRRDPYVPMDATIRRNAKLAALPSDSARLGWLYVGLGDAKLQRPAGCFRSRAHWTEVAGRFSRFLKDYLGAGLIEQAPALCDRCRTVWPNLPAGSLIVHDWKRHNTDPGAADRAADWRSEHAGEDPDEQGSNADAWPIERPLNGHQTGIEQNDAVYLARDPAGPRGGKRKRREESEVERINETSNEGSARAERPVDPLDEEAGDLPW